MMLIYIIYIRRGINRGTGKGLGISNSAALTNIVAYVVVFPYSLYQLVDVHDLGLHGLLIARTITEFFIGILYDIVIWLTDVESKR